MEASAKLSPMGLLSLSNVSNAVNGEVPDGPMDSTSSVLPDPLIQSQPSTSIEQRPSNGGIGKAKTRSSAPFWATFVAGGLSGTLGALITNPLEVVKTRMQSSGSQPKGRMLSHFPIASSSQWGRIPGMRIVGHVTETCGVLGDIYRLEGIRALWRGTGATLLGVMPSRAIYFSSYTWCKSFLATQLAGGDPHRWWVHVGAALVAGIAVNTATNPIWLVKTKMQLQVGRPGAVPYRTSWECVQHVLRTDGVRGLYRGLTASYLGAIEGALQWLLYEQAKRAISLRRHSTVSSHSDGDDPLKSMRWYDYLVIAAGAKLAAAVVAYPHEVLRTRLREDRGHMQAGSAAGNNRGLWTTARTIWIKEGPVAFYGGMTAHLMRTVPNSAIMFFAYEFLMLGYQRLSHLLVDPLD